jgi:hypothetical protein
MLPIGTSTQRSKDVDSSTMVDVAEMKTVSHRKTIVRTVVKRRKSSNHALKHHGENQKSRNQLKHQDKLPGLQSLDKGKAVCCLMHQEAAVSSTEDSTMTEAMEFVASLHTAAVMAMKITLRHSKNVNSFVTMSLAFVI